MNLLKKSQDAKATDQESGLTEWFLDDFWPRFGKQTSLALLAVAVIIAAGVWWNNDHAQSQANENKELGKAYIYLSEDKYDSAEAFLNAFVSTPIFRSLYSLATEMPWPPRFRRARMFIGTGTLLAVTAPVVMR